MTAQELEKKIMQQNKGKVFITTRALSRIIGIGSPRANEILSGLTPAYGQYGSSSRPGGKNRTKYYFVDDVVKEIMRRGI